MYEFLGIVTYISLFVGFTSCLKCIYIAMCIYSYVDRWLCGYVDMWICGCVAM